jgi:hypothetical protein
LGPRDGYQLSAFSFQLFWCQFDARCCSRLLDEEFRRSLFRRSLFRRSALQLEHRVSVEAVDRLADGDDVQALAPGRGSGGLAEGDVAEVRQAPPGQAARNRQ